MAIKKKLAAAVCMLASAAVMAQGTLGTVVNVQGPVTATTGTNSIVVTPGTPVTNGMRFITPSGTTMTMRLNSGCTVTLTPGQAVTVLQSMNCQELASSVTNTGGPGLRLGQLAGGGVANGLIIVGGVVLGALIIREITRDENLSPS